MVLLEDVIGGGTGLYTLSEAAEYARMHPNTISRWFRGGGGCNRVFSTLESGEKLITFLDFVQTLAVRNLRVNYRVPLQKIREAVDAASEKYGISHPFAKRHTTYLFEGEIWIEPETGSVFQASGRNHGQEGMRTVIEQFLKDIAFDPVTGLANRYDAFKQGSVSIVMNPKKRFGEPLIEGCGYTPKVLFESAKTEGSIDATAKLYGVDREIVEVSFAYFDFLQAA